MEAIAITVVYAATTAVALTIFVLRTLREPRRLSDAVRLGITVVSAVLLITATTAERPWHAVFVVLLLAMALVLPVALIVNGILMWQRERRHLANLLSLLAGLGLAGVIAVFVFASASPVLWINAAAASVLLLVAYVVFLVLCLLIYALAYGRFARPRKVGAIVVAGAGLCGEKAPSLLASRLTRAARLFRRETRKGGAPVVVVSGGQGPDETTSEALAMRDHLGAKGLPADRVLLEERAVTTEENLRFSADVLARHDYRGRAVVVTNNYHVFRTAVIARRLGLDLAVVGAPTAAYFLPSAFLREFVALLAHYRRTNTAAVAVLAVVPWDAAFV